MRIQGIYCTCRSNVLADFSDTIIMATTDEGVRYRNKVTIVTGGARGIGRACVELFGKFLFTSSYRSPFGKLTHQCRF